MLPQATTVKLTIWRPFLNDLYLENMNLLFFRETQNFIFMGGHTRQEGGPEGGALQ